MNMIRFPVRTDERREGQLYLNKDYKVSTSKSIMIRILTTTRIFRRKIKCKRKTKFEFGFQYDSKN